MTAKQQHTTDYSFRGFQSPNTTPVPDEMFDELLPRLSGSELKVLLYICRRTFGWKKDSDSISISQMTGGIRKKEGGSLDRGTGLVKDSVARAVKTLEQKGIIIRTRRRSERKGDEPTTYSLRFLPVSENRTPPGIKIGHGGVRKSDTQETDIQETVYKTVNGNNSDFKKLPDLVQPQEQSEYIAQRIAEELGDAKSLRFYRLIAAKVPEDVIYQALSEARQEGDNPAKLFTHKMKLYADGRLKRQLVGG